MRTPRKDTVLLGDDDPYIRMSYPDLVEDGGESLTGAQQI